MRVACLIVFAVAGAARAGGYAVPNTNARDLSMAGSLIAAQKDAAATYVNPAAMAGLEGLSIVADASLIDFKSAWTSPQGASIGHTDGLLKGAFPPSLFATYGGRSGEIGWGVGAGFNIPFGGNVYWPGDWEGRQQVITVNRRVYAWYLNGGVQPVEQVKVGAGLIYYRTTEELTQAPNFVAQEGSVELGTAGGKLAWQASVELTPLRDVPFTIGFDYKHKADQVLTGTANFENVPPPLAPNALDQGATHALTIPNTFNVGAAYRALPDLLITGAWTLDRFIVYKQDLFLGDRGTTVIVNHDFHNGYTFRLGAEYTDVVPRLTVRAGVLRDIAPSRPDTFHPAIPDSDVWAGGIGLGYRFKPELEVNATYFHAFFDSMTTTPTAAFPGTYNTRANIATVGLVWHMGPTPKGSSAALYQPSK
ncbi:MAG: OmpP1/FadL family transporter [Myxococcales bacterium]